MADENSGSDYWLQAIFHELEKLVELNERIAAKLDDIDAGIMLSNNS